MITTTFRTGDGVGAGLSANIPSVVDVCSVGVVGQWYTFNPGDVVTDQIGGGRLADVVLALLAQAPGTVYCTPAAPTWGPLPSVVKVGASPSVTVALAPAASGPFDDHAIVGTVKVGGVNGTALIAWAYDGSTVIETLPVPVEQGAIVTGTVDLNAIVYPWNALNATTIIYSAPGVKTLSLGAPTSVADLVAKLNALAVAAPLAVLFQSSQDSAGHAYLQQVSTATGLAAAITMTGGTALALLGLTAATANGTAATLSPPWTGLVLTFPATSAYVAGDTYTITATGPSASIQAITNAMAVGRSNWKTTPFGYFVVPQNPSTGANAGALQAACSSTVAPWRTDNSCPVWVMTGTPFHAASSTPATNAANITTADNAVLAAFAGNAAALDLVAVDDCYIQGSAGLRSGSFRRSAVVAAAIQRARLGKLGSDIAEGVVPGVTLRGPDLLTLARDEFYAVAKLGPAAGGLSGPGFAVLKTTMQGVGFPKFSAGVTRAGSTSRYRFSHVVVVALEMAQIAFARATGWEGQTWPTDPSNKRLLDSEAQHRADDVYTDLLPWLLPEGKDPSVSKYTVTIDNSGPFLDTGNVPLNLTFVPLGLVLDITITITAQGTILAASP